jgi:hypothetical protein
LTLSLECFFSPGCSFFIASAASLQNVTGSIEERGGIKHHEDCPTYPYVFIYIEKSNSAREQMQYIKQSGRE